MRMTDDEIREVMDRIGGLEKTKRKDEKEKPKPQKGDIVTMDGIKYKITFADNVLGKIHLQEVIEK